MVDTEDVAAGDRQQMAALAIGVVDDGVEDRDPAQAGVVLDDHRHDVLAIVGVDPELDHALTERALPEDGGRHDRPAGHLRHEVGGDLAPGQGAVGEVVERPLAADRLVDGVDGDRWLGVGAGPGHPAVHRVVRGRQQPAHDLDVALLQDVEDRRRVERNHVAAVEVS